MEILKSDLIMLVKKYRFPVSAVIDLEEISGNPEQMAQLPGAAGRKAAQLLQNAITALQVDDETGGVRKGCLLVCGLSCYEEDGAGMQSETGQAGSRGLFASFARRNHYKEVVSRLKQLTAEVRRALPIRKNTIRIFCNSALPEKLIAWLAGIGFYGRNSLIINPVLGSDFVIGGVFLPAGLKIDVASPPRAESHCTACTLCADACPAGAITGYAVIDLSRCFQALAARFTLLTEECMRKWGARIYGCQDCQDVCPYNSKLTCITEAIPEMPGPDVSLEQILILDSSSMRQFFRGTVLDRSWMDFRAILRNAIIAAGNSRDRILIRLLEKHLQAEEYVIRETARWALNRIRQEAIPEYPL